jgi:HPt (histidine-containing phosphotransfer) domain-containing protein
MSAINFDLIKSYDNKELIMFLYKNFCINVPKKIKLLEEAVADSNLLEVKRTLHALRNLFANVGAEKPAEYCQITENSVRDISDLNINVWSQIIKRSFEQTSQELKRFLDAMAY